MESINAAQMKNIITEMILDLGDTPEPKNIPPKAIIMLQLKEKLGDDLDIPMARRLYESVSIELREGSVDDSNQTIG